MATRPQIPTNNQIANSDGRITKEWYFWFTSLAAQTAPQNLQAVTDGSASLTGPTTIYQTADTLKPGAPQRQDLAFALDNGKIYTVNPSLSTWQLQSPELTGDVTKAAFSLTTQLANVNPTPGVSCGMTINAKGQVTAVSRQTAFSDVPPAQTGSNGDFPGLVAIDANYLYVCVAVYDGVSTIWHRTALTGAW